MQRLRQMEPACLSVPRRPVRAGSLAAILPLCALLGACGIAPGMRMQAPASIPLQSGATPADSVALPVPVTNIDVSLIRRMREAERGQRGDAHDIDALPDAYTIGRGDVLQITEIGRAHV